MAAGDISAQLQRASQMPGALFDGVDDYVEIPHNANQLGANLSNGFTISAWICPRSEGEFGGKILDKSEDVNGLNGFTFHVNSAGNTLRCRVSTTSVNSTTTWSTNVWTHVLVTVTGIGTTTFYFNGVAGGSGAGANTNLIITTSVMRIGNRTHASLDRTFNGSIRMVKMWNRVLTTAEIAKDYAGTKVSDGLILDVPLKDDYMDKSIFGLTGTNSGTILTNTLANQITADMKGMTLAAATDKLIVLPLTERDQRIKIIKAVRAAA
jgi:hypothetical protein